VVVLAACGRLRFDPLNGGASGDAGGDASLAGTVTATFGETGSTTYGGVTEDTYIDGATPTLNYGTTSEFYVESAQISLLRFDLSALSTTATVRSASLRVWVPSDPSVGMFELHRVLEAWTEGTGDGVAGVANAIDRMTGVAWSATFTDSTVLGTLSQPTAIMTAYDIDLLSATVGGWVADPATNFGFAITSTTTDGLGLRSSSSSATSQRPVLTVVYVP
jgi:hypothetical protein